MSGQVSVAQEHIALATVQEVQADLPAAAILDKLVELRPEWLGISATLEASLPAAEALSKLVHSTLGQTSPNIVVGGAAFQGRPDLVQLWQVAGYAGTFQEALKLLSCSH